MKKIIFLFALFIFNTLFAQDFSDKISTYLTNNQAQFALQSQDIEEVNINSQSFSKSMHVFNVYATQQYQGINIFNTTSSFVIKNNEVIKANLAFEDNISTKINTITPTISAKEAISKAANSLGIQNPSNLVLVETISNKSFVYSNGNISLENIPVALVFQKTIDNKLRLAWDLSIYLLDASHYYSVRIDAISGELLAKNDWVVSCDFGTKTHHNKVETSVSFLEEKKENFSTILGGAQYRVFPLPLASPDHGPDAIIPDPSNVDASPFGWHDTNGAAGAEFTITRGNNVWAQDDINGNNGTGASPDGGASLNFDFPFDFNSNPGGMLDASTVNLFYWNNIMHDVWYQYGFDEASGNFQENNYGAAGASSDSVNADAQDGSGSNNANFATPPDGGNPRMQMFLWSPAGAATPVEILTINNGPLAGTYNGVPANFGGSFPTTPLTEDIVVVEDDDSGVSNDPNDGCDPLTNAASLDGKIVIIRRGECEFGFKALAAQDENAVAVIIVNNVAGDPIIMAPGAVGSQVTIPLFMVSNVDGDAIIAELTGGGNINGTISGDNISPNLDGDVDNGIVVHEYGHGISTRLTGGPGNSGCLQNAEQMGEGWSDWFAVMLTMKAGDLPEDPRGIGTYVSGQPTDGQGIRNAPYSTDFAVNDFTYGDTNNAGLLTQPHGIGFVWATMLWDLNWAFIDQYGFDDDFYNGTGGNNIVMQLVIDALKLQPCSPGFVDGRDAILQADELVNNGDNRCLIWNVFANRGLGLSADQGSSFSRTDQTEAFDIPSGTDCTLSTGDNSLANNFVVYPNPAKGTVNILSRNDIGNATISIFDINGLKVYNKDIELHNNTSINVDKLSIGVYILQINGENYFHTSKLIIE